MLTVLATLCVAWLMPAQDSHQTLSDRGAMVMGFDQDKTVHHFYLYQDGGAIDIAVKDVSDSKDRDGIRSHLPHIAQMFGAGDFDAPMFVHDSKDVPGTRVLTKQKDKIAYRYNETPMGGRVDIVTKDADALAALHDFLVYQIKEHQTGDPVTVSKRK
jgi:hypothetical protein